MLISISALYFQVYKNVSHFIKLGLNYDRMGWSIGKTSVGCAWAISNHKHQFGVSFIAF